VTSVTEEQRESIPPYLRIAAALRERILASELQPGQMLPSTTRIAQEEGVSTITAAKALKVLHSEGLAYSVQGLGTFVAGDAQAD
jgi:DNA-binding GntR family transcriptional regulator